MLELAAERRSSVVLKKWTKTNVLLTFINRFPSSARLSLGVAKHLATNNSVPINVSDVLHVQQLPPTLITCKKTHRGYVLLLNTWDSLLAACI